MSSFWRRASAHGPRSTVLYVNPTAVVRLHNSPWQRRGSLPHLLVLELVYCQRFTQIESLRQALGYITIFFASLLLAIRVYVLIHHYSTVAHLRWWLFPSIVRIAIWECDRRIICITTLGLLGMVTTGGHSAYSVRSSPYTPLSCADYMHISSRRSVPTGMPLSRHALSLIRMWISPVQWLV